MLLTATLGGPGGSGITMELLIPGFMQTLPSYDILIPDHRLHAQHSGTSFLETTCRCYFFLGTWHFPLSIATFLSLYCFTQGLIFPVSTLTSSNLPNPLLVITAKKR